MNGKIAGFIENLVSSMLGGGGVSVNNTLELQNYKTSIPIQNTSWEIEYSSMRDLCRRCGLSIEAKYKEEEYHYEFLKYALLQKVRAVKYFHNQGIESRKLVVFSEDCISMLQWLSRPSVKTNFLNIYIRSSDVLGLLGCDLLYLYEIYLRMVSEYPEVAEYVGYLDIWIASAHIYWDPQTRTPMTREGKEILL